MKIMAHELIERYKRTPTEELVKLHQAGTLPDADHQAVEQELLRRGASLPPGPTGADPAPKTSEDIPKGIGGWLLVFIYTYTLSPFFAGGQYYIYQGELRNLAQQFPELETQLHISAYLNICALLLAAGSALTFYIVYALLYERRGAVFLAKLGLVLFIINNILIAPLLKIAFFGYNYFAQAGLGEFMLVQSIISLPAVAWYLYFSLSRRVKATYSS